jgi:hypothetical protein
MANSNVNPKIAILVLALLGSSLLSACGGGEATVATAGASSGTDPVAAAAAGSSSATGLTISGTPLTSIAAGRAYGFTPTVTQTAGVSFSISNKPAWATFNTVTGALGGTPTDANIGTTAGIVITANNAATSATLAAFSLAVTQATASVGAASLSWNPPTQNTDGSSVSNLGGYNIYYGTSAESLTNKIQVSNAGLTAYTVSNLDSGTYFFGISAYTTSGAESDVAVVGSKTIS